jgi:uncharacterized membrane protein
MAKDISDVGDLLGSALGTIAREVAENVSGDGHGARDHDEGPLEGLRGVAAGAALAAVPMAGLAARKMVMRRITPGGAGGAMEKLTEGAKGAVSDGVKGAVDEKMDKVGPGGVVKKAGKSLMSSVPGLGGKGEGEGKGESKGESGSSGEGAEAGGGVGKGRRMPVQQAVDIGVPISVAYNQWTQFEEWPQFMHRVDQVSQEEETSVHVRVKVWGMSKEFDAEIVEQRPDERIEWKVTEGVAHSGVVTFHELAHNLTRMQVTLDVEPGSWIEKMARGMRHVKRAVRGDLHRFKAFIEMQEEETGAWRGVIHEGELAKKEPKEEKAKSSSGSSSRSKSKSSSNSTSKSKSSKPKARSRDGSSGGSSKSSSSKRKRTRR